MTCLKNIWKHSENFSRKSGSDEVMIKSGLGLDISLIFIAFLERKRYNNICNEYFALAVLISGPIL